MKTLVVGGKFDYEGWYQQRSSKIIELLAKAIGANAVYNGGTHKDLCNMNLSGYDLIIWAADVDNHIKKFYPKKDPGAVLIVTKVLRENRTQADALQRVFAMHGNAVITIDKEEELLFGFKLIDALNNSWGESRNIENLAEYITKFYEWSKGSQRIWSEQYVEPSLSELIEINNQVADICEHSNVGRYFGNLSTRCMKMFPSLRQNQQMIWVSRRNVDKKRLTEKDMVLTWMENGIINYLGSNKPSIDTPIQIKLYKRFPSVNFMIHGHAHIAAAPTTKHYFPCGDLREVDEIVRLIEEDTRTNNGIINLKNHGFLIYAETIERLQRLVDQNVRNSME